MRSSSGGALSVALFVCATSLGCQDSDTRVHVTIGGAAGLSALTLTIELDATNPDAGPAAMPVTQKKAYDHAPAAVQIFAPDRTAWVTATLVGGDAQGGRFQAAGTVQTVLHRQVELPLVFGTEVPDGGGASCTDHQKNGDETAEDCGGSCPPCAVALGCAKDGDCETGACDPIDHTCALATAPPFWLPTAGLLAPLAATCAVLGEDRKIYVAGGYDDTFTATTRLETYDRESDSWVTPLGARLGVARANASIAAGQGQIVIFGGTLQNGQPSDAYDEYPIGGPSTLSMSMPTPNGGAGAVYDPDMARMYLVDGMIDTSPAAARLAVFVPATSNWSLGHAPVLGRYQAPAVLGTDRKVYVFGGVGVNDGNDEHNVERYDPATNTWGDAPAMPTARHAAAAVTGPDGRIYVVGGRLKSTTTSIATVEAYTPATMRWSHVSDLSTPRSGLGGSIGPDGRIYAIGGYTSNPDGILVTVEAYGPVLTLNPPSGPPGTTLMASGRNFSANAQISVSFDSGAAVTSVSDASGTLAGIALTVPTVPAATHLVKAVDSRSRFPVTRPFVVP
jgi:N-acetylneuraminic acid mutarotase